MRPLTMYSRLSDLITESVDEEAEMTFRTDDIRYEGWLQVCEGYISQMPHASSQRFPTKIPWHPGYCVARTDEKSLICYRNEQEASRTGRHLNRVRLDGGFRSFWKYWRSQGSIPEPVNNHGSYGNLHERNGLLRYCSVGEPYRPHQNQCYSTLKEEVYDTGSGTSQGPHLRRCAGSFRASTLRPLRKPEACYNETDDGTESLDRRIWPQKGLVRTANNESSNNLMSMSAINTPNVYYHEGPAVTLIDEPSTPQRLAHFLSKPFRNNPLKRTKSVSKLEKTLRVVEPSRTSSRPDLRRSQDNILSVAENGLKIGQYYYGSRFNNERGVDRAGLRASQSHESLLSYSTTSHMIDLGSTDTRVHSVHPSVLNVPNCFKVANTYYACRTPLERNRWIENIRRTMNPNLDMTRRTENSLEMWILEAKGVPQKRKYYCEICLDKTLYARTSAKPRLDICFWGEHFDFSPIAKLDDVCVNLYREADPKKKKDRSTLIGYVQIKIDQLSSRYAVERWYTVTVSTDGNKSSSINKDKNETAAIRIKARYQSVEILPMEAYEDLAHCIRHNYQPLCLTLEPLLGVKAKEDFATSLVRIMHRGKMVKNFLCDLVMSEVKDLDNEHLMFRGNSLATKAMEAYMKLVAAEYLQETLGDFVRSVLDSVDNCEVDPLKMSSVNPSILEANRAHLTFNVEAAWGKIVNSSSKFPIELRQVFDSLRRRLEDENRRDLADNLISSSIFLRFLCPAILSPSLFNLVSEYPSGRSARNLTLIAKTLQTLANFSRFGGKEHYMEFMNEFVEREWNNMHHFLVQISTVPSLSDAELAALCSDSTVIDLGRELSLLHTYLNEVWTEKVHSDVVKHGDRLKNMKLILERLNRRAKRSSRNDFVDYNCPTARSPISDYENSGVLRSHNSNGTTNPYGYGQSSNRTQTIMRSTPAAHLNTNDDYVLDIALLNDSLAVRQAGIFVQQHRNAHRQNLHSSREQLLTKSPSSVRRCVDDVAHMRTSSLNGYQHSSGSGTTTSSTASRSSTKSYSTSTTDRQNDDESDSDNVNGTPARQMRPTRKGRRRANPTSVFAVDNSSHTQIVAQPPPSSGYQSQNASGSSNSNSPVERSSNCMTTHPNSQMPLQIANPMYSTHLNGPSTSAVATFESNVRLGHCRRTKSPASEIRTKTLQNPNYSTSLSHHPESSYDGSKSSVPRTNPRCSGRLSLGGFPVNAISKSSFNDDHEPECSTVVATPARTTCDADQNDENQKQNGIWTPVEIRPPVPDHGRQPVRKNEQNTSPTQNPQEIIEQQKREIMRLMRENEELKRHVARNQVRQKRHFQTAKPNSPQKLIDSGASDDSYDSLNSLNDLPSATLEQNTTTRC